MMIHFTNTSPTNTTMMRSRRPERLTVIAYRPIFALKFSLKNCILFKINYCKIKKKTKNYKTFSYI